MEEKKTGIAPLPHVIFKMGLKPIDIAIFAYLNCICDYDTNTARVKMITIAKMFAVSRDTVKRSLYRLCDKKLIRIEYGGYILKNGQYCGRCNIYHILPHTFRTRKNMIE
ncbi:MAG: hypothetical protein K5761_06720 [Clostridiales bacterium]|nr:hypothetical protein [Clostridiales bacterium]